MTEQQLEYARMGFELSYRDPAATMGIPLAEPWASWYRLGMEEGRKARAEADATYAGPAIDADPGGVALDEYNRHINELIEVLFHQHEPHIEAEGEVQIVPGPGVL